MEGGPRNVSRKSFVSSSNSRLVVAMIAFFVLKLQNENLSVVGIVWYRDMPKIWNKYITIYSYNKHVLGTMKDLKQK